MDNDIIDSHLHVFDLELRSNFPNQNWSHEFPSPTKEKAIHMNITQEYAKEIVNAQKVGKVIFVMCFDDCPEESQWVYENAQKTDLIIGIVAGLDLTKHDKLRNYIGKFKKDFIKPKFVGIRHHICHDDKLLFHPDFQEGLRILQEEQIPFDLGINDSILKFVPDLAKKFPRLKMVIDHLAKPQVPLGDSYLEKWKGEISSIARYPNVFMKLSGMVVLAEPWSRQILQPYIDHCIKEFTAKRCMFGSDWPVCRLAENTDYGDVLRLLKDATSNLSPEDRKWIFHDTVTAFYGL